MSVLPDNNSIKRRQEQRIHLCCVSGCGGAKVMAEQPRRGGETKNGTVKIEAQDVKFWRTPLSGEFLFRQAQDGSCRRR
jgi:hypothetical protein